MEQRKQKFTESYNQYADAIFRYCYFKISDREKATDFVSETFTRTWQYLLSGNEIENIKTFLYTTARHIIIDEYRKKKSVSLDDLIDQGLEPYLEIEEAIFTSYEVERILKYVQQLPESYMTVILLRYVEDLSVKEIAVITNETENVISVRIHRGLAKLRKLIQV